MIKLLNPLFPIGKYYSKLLLIMKLNVIFLVLCTFQISANSYSQNAKVDLKMEDATLADIFNEIEAQSEYRIFYRVNDLDLSKQYSVDFKNSTAKDVLDKVLDGSGSTFKCIDKIIVISSSLNDQQIVVKGKITDIDGNPLPGVNVVEKSTTNGAVTNIDGEYTISLSSAEAILSFSFIGYLTEEIEVAGKTTIDLSMVEDIQSLEEVVVIGYGSVKKGDLTGAIGTVKGDNIAERQTTQISQALQGSVAGVMVTRDNSAPGAKATIRIRGITTIGENDPLVIVDGVPVNDINNINPNDIENISVLKDAASAAIYGSRAAAGVILVTTKRAEAGQLTMTYNTSFGIEKPTRLPEYVNAVRYMQMANELKWNDNNNADGGEFPTYAEDVINNYMTLNAQDPNNYPNTDWMGLILDSYAPKQSHVFSIMAGTEKIKTRASIAYDNIDGLYMGKSYQRLTARINNDAKVSKILSTSLDFFFKRSISNNPSMDPMYNAMISAPVYAAEWEDGRVAEGKSGANIYGQLKYGGYKEEFYNSLGGKASIDLTPLDGLKISAVLSPNFGFDKGKDFQKRVPYYSANDPTVYVGTLQWASSTNLTEERNESYNLTTQFLVNYDKSFGQHYLNLLGGYENYYAFYEELSASRDQYLLNSYPYLDLGPLEYRNNEGSAYENAYRSWFGRMMYNYAHKYYIQANIRFDASSRFHEDYRWGSFPSFSAGWVISEEDFMQNIPVLSYLKLRGSWGVLGNERIGNYPYQSTIGFGNALFYQGSNIVSAQTAAQWQYAIQDISWETTESFNFGADVQFYDGKLRLTGDYFIKETKDMLLELEIPDYIGFDNPDQNTGIMETKGWELEAGWNDRIGELGYSISFNLSDFKSVMGDLGGTEFLGNQIKIEGSEFNEWYGYQSAGLFQTADEVANSAVTNNAVSPGDVKYVDISGPDGEPDGAITPEYDRVLLGGSLPRYMFGSNIQFDYKGFDVSFVIQGVGKQNIRKPDIMVRPLMNEWGHIPKIIDGNYWSVYNTAEQNASAEYPRLTYKSGGNDYTMSDYWLMNGAYLRMKNITIGYRVPQSLTEKAFIKNLRIYASLNDLFTIDKFPKGWDPEVGKNAYPITSSYLLGLSINF